MNFCPFLLVMTMSSDGVKVEFWCVCVFRNQISQILLPPPPAFLDQAVLEVENGSEWDSFWIFLP